MAARYVPDRGDVVWLQFNPQTGHEQAGHRPALVVSLRAYNHKVGLALLCPITSSIKGYPFEVVLPAGLKTKGAVLCDQLKNFDWRVHKAKKAGTVPPELLDEVVARILPLLDPEGSLTTP